MRLVDDQNCVFRRGELANNLECHAERSRGLVHVIHAIGPKATNTLAVIVGEGKAHARCDRGAETVVIRGIGGFVVEYGIVNSGMYAKDSEPMVGFETGLEVEGNGRAENAREASTAT